VLDVLEKAHHLLNPESKSALPETRAAAAQYLLLLGMSSKSVDLSRVITSDYSKVKVAVLAAGNDSKSAEHIYDQLRALAEKHCPEMRVVFAGGHMIHIVNMRNVVWGKVQNVVSSMVTVFLVLVLVYRSISRGLASLLTLPVGIAANFGLMGFAGIPLDLVSAVVTSVAMGVGTDITIHMITAIRDRYRKFKDMDLAVREAVQRHGEAMIYNGMSDILGFSILLLSRFKTLQSLGILMVFSLFVLQMSALLLVPAFVRVVEPDFITQLRRKTKTKQSTILKVVKFGMAAVIVLVCSYVAWMIDQWS
jgi:predicted RND superfamily exporter protein